ALPLRIAQGMVGAITMLALQGQEAVPTGLLVGQMHGPANFPDICRVERDLLGARPRRATPDAEARRLTAQAPLGIPKILGTECPRGLIEQDRQAASMFRTDIESVGRV